MSGMVLSLRNVSWIQGWWFEGVDVGLHSPRAGRFEFYANLESCQLGMNLNLHPAGTIAQCNANPFPAKPRSASSSVFRMACVIASGSGKGRPPFHECRNRCAHTAQLRIDEAGDADQAGVEQGAAGLREEISRLCQLLQEHKDAAAGLFEAHKEAVVDEALKRLRSETGMAAGRAPGKR